MIVPDLQPPQPWMADGVCAQADPDEWFPEKGAPVKTAKRICRTSCDVQARCLAYALATRERFGVWGGMSERERRSVLRGTLPPVVSVHGLLDLDALIAAPGADLDDLDDDELDAAA